MFQTFITIPLMNMIMMAIIMTMQMNVAHAFVVMDMPV
jgi:hypothetical protein